MPHYKAPNNSVHFIDSSEFENLLPAGSVPITTEEAEVLTTALASSVVPQVVDMAQARLALLAAGLLDQVETALNMMEGTEGQAARIEWNFRARVRRDSTLVQSLAIILELSSADLDELFTSAAGL